MLIKHRADALLTDIAEAMAERHTAHPTLVRKMDMPLSCNLALATRPLKRPAGQQHTNDCGDDGADLQGARCFAEKPPPTE